MQKISFKLYWRRKSHPHIQEQLDGIAYNQAGGNSPFFMIAQPT